MRALDRLLPDEVRALRLCGGTSVVFQQYSEHASAATTQRGLLAPIVGGCSLQGGPVSIVKCGEDRLRLAFTQTGRFPYRKGTIMKTARYLYAAAVVTGALAISAISGVVFAQLPPGRIYAFDSSANGSCPPIDWHIVVGPNNTFTGMISWDGMKSMAHVTGSADPQTGAVQMTAQEVGGQGRTATIDGTVQQDGWMVTNIKGDNVACQGLSIPWFTPPPTR